MPSPICQVKDGAGAYQATTNGVDVTPTNTITINLVSSAGVNTWSIQCITTDELSDAAAVTASLTIDPVAKTATFTAPAAGRAYRFQSKVNSGIDANGVAQSSYTTTFCVYTLTSSGTRVHAVDETFESHATFGWIGDLNTLIRSGGGGAPDGSGTEFQYRDGANFAGAGNVSYVGNKLQTLANLQWKNGSITGDLAWAPTSSNKTITLPDATGTVALLGATQTLENKTVVLADNTVTDTSAAQYDILEHNGTRFVRKAKGADNTVLQVNGSGALVYAQVDLTAQAAAGGLNTVLVSGGSTVSWAAVTNAVVDASAAIAGTKISPDFGSQNITTTGLIQRTASLVAIATDASNCVVGGNTSFANAFTNTRMTASGAITLAIGSSTHLSIISGEVLLRPSGVNCVKATTADVKFGVPVAGSSTDSVPFRFKRAVVAVAGNTTLSAAQYECPFLDIDPDIGLGGNFDIVAPNTAGSTFNIKNNTSFTATIKKSGGTGFTIASGAVAWAHHDGTDYEQR